MSREADDEKPNGTERDDRGKGNQGGKGSMLRGKLPKPWILCSSKHAGPLPHPFSWDKASYDAIEPNSTSWSLSCAFNYIRLAVPNSYFFKKLI